jgi:ATP-dependent Clp protease ATP-binding subunit ClpB
MREKLKPHIALQLHRILHSIHIQPTHKLIQNAQSIAAQQNHQQIEPEHLFIAMLGEQEGIARSILHKLGISPENVTQDLNAAIGKFPSVGGMGDAYLSSGSKNMRFTMV